MRTPVGTHVPVGGHLVRGALATAVSLGCEVVQVFVGNPRGWAPAAGDPAVDAAFAERSRAAGLRTFVHAPYLVNLGSPTPLTFERSVATVEHTLGRAARVGAEGVVVHTGSAVDDAEGRGYAAGLRQVREGLLPVLDHLDELAEAPRLLLEPTAGQGRSLCAGVEDLGPYLEALEHHPALGICLDTCHAFAAGEPLDEPGGAHATLDRLAAVAGGVPLALVHANDSADPRGSLKDRHARIGEGLIGETAFAELLAHPLSAGVPYVLETPGSREDASQIRLLKRIRDGIGAAQPPSA